MLLGHVLRKRWTLTNLLKADGAGASLAFSLGAHGYDTHVVNNLLASYQRLLQSGSLLPDATQAAAVRALQLLQDAILTREAQRAGAEDHHNHHHLARQNYGGSTSSTSSTSSDANAGNKAAETQERTTYAHPRTGGILDPASTTPPTTPPTTVVRGAYLWGPVGSGKTALMDLFALTTRHRLEEEAAAAAVEEPQLSAARSPVLGKPRFGVCVRQHFHEFMQGVHGRLHELQVQRPRVVARSRQGMMVYRYAEPEEDPLITVAGEWGRRTAVLCLDELHVTDVADAMILSRLFGSLLVDFHTTVLFTSNRPPNDLYKGGLSRKYFEPFVQLVDEQMVALRVAADVDYRRRAETIAEPASAVRRHGGRNSTVEGTAAAAAVKAEHVPGDTASQGAPGRWLVGSGAVAVAAAEEHLRSLWQQRPAATATGGSGGGDSGPVAVPLAYGRTLKVPCALGDAAWFTFEQLCGAVGLGAAVDDGGALAAPDFLALCRRFRELYVTGVPELGPAQRDEARRFVTLLDIAYDNRCRLAVAASVPPDALFAPLLEEARRQGINPRLGLPKTARQTRHRQEANAAVGCVATTTSLPSASSATTAVAAVAAATVSNFVPAASITAALHASLGPSMTHGSSAVANNIAHPSEFTGTPPQAAFSQQRPSPADLTVPRALFGEEVLMYHRAVSRLAEMCSVDWVTGV